MNKTSEYISKTQHCPLCQSSKWQSAKMPPTHWQNIQFKYLSCLDCHSIYLSPMPSEEILQKMYAPTEYHEKFYNMDNAEETKNEALWTLLEKFISYGKLLDVGCGAGHFMKHAQTQGFEAYGCELHQSLVSALRKKGGNVFYIHDLFSNESFKEYFDLLYFGHVLEHLTNPAGYLKNFLTLLKPNGYILIDGPLENQFNLAKFCLQFYKKYQFISHKVDAHIPYHVTWMTNKGIKSLLKFSKIRILKSTLYEALWPLGIAQPKSIREWTKYILGRSSQIFSHSPIGKKLKFGNRIMLIGKKENYIPLKH